MSSDRLARMKAERERARGIVPQSPTQGQGQGGYEQQQQMYPVGGGNNNAGYAPPPQQGSAAPPAGYNNAPLSQGQPPLQQQQQQPLQQPYGQQQQEPYGQQPQQQDYNAAGPGYAQQSAPPGPGSDLNAFFGEIDNINNQLQQLKGNINQINALHNAVLNSTINEQRQEQAQNDLAQLTNETSRLTNQIKLRIKNLSELNDKIPNVAGNEGEKNTRRLQVAAQKKKFMDLIQEYREVEKKSRDRYKARMERQYKIVKPDASEAEIKQAIETDQGSQVFANALTQSTRYADARNAYREVQERHEDIKKIAQTMTELQDLFNDMAMLVERQDEAIINVEANATNVEENMEGGYKEIEKGKEKARKARRKRIWCFWILVIIIIIVVLAVTLSILSNQGKL